MATQCVTDLSADVMNVLQKTIDIEHKKEVLQRSVDRLLEMHNAIMDWVCETDFTEASREVMGILEEYVRPVKPVDNIDHALTGEGE
jgi:hypothetical protein